MILQMPGGSFYLEVTMQADVSVCRVCSRSGEFFRCTPPCAARGCACIPLHLSVFDTDGEFSLVASVDHSIGDSSDVCIQLVIVPNVSP